MIDGQWLLYVRSQYALKSWLDDYNFRGYLKQREAKP